MKKITKMKNFKIDLQMFASENPVVSANQVINDDVNNDLMLINPNNAPLVSMLRNKGVDRATSTTIKWVDNFVRPAQDVLDGAITDVAVTLDVTDVDFIINGILLSVEEEIMLVTAVAGVTATVTRGYAGTTAVAHADGVELRNMGFDNEETEEYRASKSKVQVNISNNTRIFTESYELSRTAQEVASLGNGVATELAKQELKAKERLMAQMEYAYIHGVKFESGNKRGNDGLLNLVGTYGITYDAGAAAISIDKLEDVTELIFRAGGQGELSAGQYYVLANTNQTRKINDFNASKVRTERGEQVAGELVNFVDTNVGRINIMQVPSMPTDKILIVNLENATEKELAAFRILIQGTNGLVDRYQIDGESTIEMVGLPKSALIENLTV